MIRETLDHEVFKACLANLDNKDLPDLSAHVACLDQEEKKDLLALLVSPVSLQEIYPWSDS